MSRPLTPRSLTVASSVATLCGLLALPFTARAQAALHVTVPAHLFAGTSAQLATDAHGAVRWSTSDPTRAWVDASGRLVLLRDGRVTVSAATNTDSVAQEITVERNPARAITLEVATPAAGGRARINAMALDGDNRPLPDVPVSIAANNGVILRDGDSTLLVAPRAGELDLIAQSGDAATSAVLSVADAGVVQQGAPAAARIVANADTPVRKLVLRSDADRTIVVGDTVEMKVEAWGLGARRIMSPAVLYAVVDAPNGAATVTANGRFVALEPGMYTVVAAAGTHADRQTIFVAAHR